GAGARSATRRRAGLVAPDPGRPAARMAARLVLGDAAAPLGTRVRAPRGAAGWGGRGGPTLGAATEEAAEPAERRRPRAVQAAPARRRGTARVLAALAARAATGLGRKRPPRQRRLQRARPRSLPRLPAGLRLRRPLHGGPAAAPSCSRALPSPPPAR